MKWIQFTIFLCLTAHVFCQGWMPQGGRSAALGDASVAITDIYAFHHNPGALGFLEEGAASVSYQNRFLLRELQSQSFTAALPISKGVLSVGGQFYGYESFRTNRFGIGYALPLNEKFALGTQINYLNLRLDPYYGVKHSVTGEIGALVKLSDELSIGASVFNLGRARLSDFKDDRLSTIIRLGVAYKVIPELLVTSEIFQEIGFGTRLKAGLEYQPHDILYLRLGAQGGPVEFSFGSGLNLKNVKLDLATHYHQLLGWTPHIAFIYSFANGE